jgi:hypothetical protein
MAFARRGKNAIVTTGLLDDGYENRCSAVRTR